MIIYNGPHNQNLSIFFPAQTVVEELLWLKNPYGDDDYMFPFLSLD